MAILSGVLPPCPPRAGPLRPWPSPGGRRSRGPPAPGSPPPHPPPPPPRPSRGHPHPSQALRSIRPTNPAEGLRRPPEPWTATLRSNPTTRNIRHMVGPRRKTIMKFFPMNGIYLITHLHQNNIWECCGFGCSTCSAYATPPNPPASTITGEPIFVQSYINAYATAFNQETTGFSGNYQVALYKYFKFTSSEVNNNFVPGTFGYFEEYNSLSQPQSFYINYLQDDASMYSETPYLFVSAGSGGGSGFMYLDWIIVTYGVPYVINVS